MEPAGRLAERTAALEYCSEPREPSGLSTDRSEPTLCHTVLLRPRVPAVLS